MEFGFNDNDETMTAMMIITLIMVGWLVGM